MLQVAKGLHYLHSKRVAHLRLNLSHILVAYDRYVVLSGFALPGFLYREQLDDYYTDPIPSSEGEWRAELAFAKDVCMWAQCAVDASNLPIGE